MLTRRRWQTCWQRCVRPLLELAGEQAPQTWHTWLVCASHSSIHTVTGLLIPPIDWTAMPLCAAQVRAAEQHVRDNPKGAQPGM